MLMASWARSRYQVRPAGGSVRTESRNRARAAGGMSARDRYIVTTVPVEPTMTSRTLGYFRLPRAETSAAKRSSASGQRGSRRRRETVTSETTAQRKGFEEARCTAA